MLISSVIQDSFQEYNGEQATVFFSKGCNLKCTYCYNYKTVTGSEVLGEFADIFEEYITPMTTAVVFLGGEPTVWGEKLIESIDLVKSKYPHIKIKLYTNGIESDIIKSLHNKIDAISIDFKCIGLTADMKKVLGVNNSNYLHYVETTCRIAYDWLIRGDIGQMDIRTTKNEHLDDVEIESIKYAIGSQFPNANHVIQNKFEVDDG